MSKWLLCAAAAVVSATAPMAHARQDDRPALADPGGAKAAAVKGTLDKPVSGSGVQLTAGQDGGNLTLKSNWKITPPDSYSYLAWNLTLTAPLDKDADITKLATLDGLANAATLQVGMEGGWVTGWKGPPTLARFAEQRRICTDAGLPAGCGVPDLVAANDLPRANEFANLDFSPTTKVFLWNIAGKVGRQDLTYYDAATLVKHDLNKSPWSASAYLSMYPRQADYLFTVGYQYQRAYTEAKSEKRCGPTPPGTCVEGPIGPPVETDKQLVSLEWRGETKSYAYSVTATYDAEADVLGVDAPIYMTRDAAGDWSGGVRLGWRDDTGEVTTSIFVSKPFALFGANE